MDELVISTSASYPAVSVNLADTTQMTYDKRRPRRLDGMPGTQHPT